MTLGYGATVDFRDSNKAISIANTKKVTQAFNRIEINSLSGASPVSRVDWTNIAIQALGTVSRGQLEMIDDCDVNFNGCTFTDMDTFIFLSQASVLGCTFRRCNEVDAGGADMTGCLFATPSVDTDSAALIWDVNTNPNGLLDDCVFTKGTNAHHAIEFGTNSPTSMTLTGVTFSGFNASNGEYDSAIHFKRTSGDITLYCATTPSYLSDGANVTIVGTSVSVTVACKTAAGANVSGARVILMASDATGPFPFEESVSITNSGTTATVLHYSHNMATNDKIVINGASHWENNGVFSITVIDTDRYSYTMPSSPGSDPTGTITATFCALEGLTGAGGTVTTSRAYSSNQPVVGWARKSSAAPYYKTAPLSGEVDSSAGFSSTAVMILDQ